MKTVILVPVIIFTFVICSMGQTFQYSRGWTNGKRSDSHFHEDSIIPEIIEIDLEKKLEKCLLNLQRIIHNPYALHYSSLPGRSGKNFINHHSSDGPEELVADPTSDRFKRSNYV